MAKQAVDCSVEILLSLLYITHHCLVAQKITIDVFYCIICVFYYGS